MRPPTQQRQRPGTGVRTFFQLRAQPGNALDLQLKIDGDTGLALRAGKLCARPR